jgi:hypothetical protein
MRGLYELGDQHRAEYVARREAINAQLSTLTPARSQTSNRAACRLGYRTQRTPSSGACSSTIFVTQRTAVYRRGEARRGSACGGHFIVGFGAGATAGRTGRTSGASGATGFGASRGAAGLAGAAEFHDGRLDA